VTGATINGSFADKQQRRNTAAGRSSDVDMALAKVGAMAKHGYDADYLATHELRFRRTAQRVMELAPASVRILDIGSHYLHLSAILRLLGYEVWAVDVPAFQELPYVRERADLLGIHTIASDSIQDGNFLQGHEDRFGLVLFCEILEHITFNPCDFWNRVHHLLQTGGKLYITTPNSLAAMSILSVLKRLVLLEGTGLDIPSILGTVTYGHHWKEYSRKEIMEYFRRLSPDFAVEVSTYCWRAYSYSPGNLLDWGRRLIRWTANHSKVFADELEVVVTLTTRSKFGALGPAFG
jgi:2-polyprenyl-6-hydroxyphenyl methylase/3-demethylubiquinone-9 3-methyltransferase